MDNPLVFIFVVNTSASCIALVIDLLSIKNIISM